MKIICIVLVTQLAGAFAINNNLIDGYYMPTCKSVGSSDAISKILLSQPLNRAVFQRDRLNKAMVPVHGTIFNCGVTINAVQSRYIRLSDGSKNGVSWQAIPLLPGGTFDGQLEVPAGGWYSIEVRALHGEVEIVRSQVDKIGVGEVFITAGQSNSANYGSPALAPTHDFVSAWTGTKWCFASDPQPMASGSNGSPWSRLGDLLADQMGVPIGFISVGIGGTRVDEWVPGAKYYPRLQSAISAAGSNRIRAILWHQGESDSLNHTSADLYANRLISLINQTRADAGWQIPWGVAIVGFHPSATDNDAAVIREGQRLVIHNVDGVFEGPNTDLLGPTYRCDTVHFNNQGLYEHASGWKRAVSKYLSDDGSGTKRCDK